jgi:hypothetical protein
MGRIFNNWRRLFKKNTGNPLCGKKGVCEDTDPGDV